MFLIDCHIIGYITYNFWLEVDNDKGLASGRVVLNALLIYLCSSVAADVEHQTRMGKQTRYIRRQRTC